MKSKLTGRMLVLLTALGASTACTTNHGIVRPEAVSLGAGNAQAANTVLQLVDPWPAGVNDTELDVPADIAQHKPKADEKADGVKTSNLSQ